MSLSTPVPLRNWRAPRALGWAIIIITNQSGIGRGYFTVDQFHAVQEEVYRQLGVPIDGAYMSPDLPHSDSLRRKPAPGMISRPQKNIASTLLVPS
jgi:D-glycero-D-manno-heptose 1,7-bisphosphate phosphatase